jgi:subtilisin family serine protease
VPHRSGFARIVCVVLLALASGALLAASSAARVVAGEHPANAAPTTPATSAIPGRVIVVWKAGADRGDRLAARAGAEAGFVTTLGDARFQLLRPHAGRSVAEALAALRDDPNVQTATRDTLDVLHATTNDPLFAQQWGLRNLGAGIEGFTGALAGADVNALAAWDRTRGTSSTVIADLDSGYRFDAPDLAPVAWTNPNDPANGADDDHDGIVDDTHGADFVGSSADSPVTDGNPTDDDVIDGGHGVHTAGTIGAAGNNGIGVSGVAQDVRIMPLRVCAYSASAEAARCPTSSQIAAINYAGAHGARAANMSLGGTSSNTAVRDAFANNPNVLFVISAGNDGEDNDVTPHYPCGYEPQTSGIPGAVDNVICVAALDQADHLASFSDWGARSVDVGAPGTEILSTYPARVNRFTDDFEVNDFATNWPFFADDGPFARSNEAPLSSFGMTDTPGLAPTANTVRESFSRAIAIPAGDGACTFTQTRIVHVSGNGFYEYGLYRNGRLVIDFGPISSSGTVSTGPISGLAGTSVQVAVLYSAGSSPSSVDGVWLDDLKLDCNAPLTTPPTYGFLQGTSMAAPHVTGAAGLLFSLNPSASVAQVRSALLATVHPVAALAGKTTAGGRIDAAAALDEIRQPDTGISSAPHGSTKSRSASFSFARTDAALSGPFQCQLDGGAFSACTSPASYAHLGGGSHTFAVRALSPRGIVADPSPATATWTVIQCKVPKLKGKTLKRAKRALRKAHCRLGKVKRPRHSRHKRLVVKGSRPKAHAIRTAGTRVKLTLKLKPAKHKHRRHHARRRR